MLTLTETAVTDAGLEHLKALPRLGTLLLSHTRVTDRGLEHLKDVPRLRTVFLDDTRVTAAGVAALEKARPDIGLGMVGDRVAGPTK